MRITASILKTKCENIDKDLYIGSQYGFYQVRNKDDNKQYFSGTPKECASWLDGYYEGLNKIK